MATNITMTAVAATTGVTVWGYQTEAATSIESVQADNTSSLFPLPSSFYDLLGRPVTSPQKPGIYIKNGKKFIVK